MSDRELDKELFDLLGGAFGVASFCCPECGGTHFGSNGDLRYCHDEFSWGCDWHGAPEDAAPHYSRDIRYAWQILTYMRGKSDSAIDDSWEKFVEELSLSFNYKISSLLFELTPLQICRAALAALKNN